MTFRSSVHAHSLLLAVLACPSLVDAALSANVAAGGWPNAAHRQAAVDSLQAIVNRYNAYGDFGNYSIYTYYNAGIPTAQSDYLGSIGFGGTYPNERVTLHETNHYLGSGTYAHTYDGPRAVAMLEQFEGVGARFGTDGTHFWPYGMNYDNEWSELAARRNIPLMYALRADWGIGSKSNPTAWASNNVALKASDAAGTSAFNYPDAWNDNTFAHPNAAYSTGNFTLRTPAGAANWAFAGNSLTVNNTNGSNGGLLLAGNGNTSIVTIKNLTLDGGYLRQGSGVSNVSRLAGKVTLAGSPTVDVPQGAIVLSGDVAGSGSLTKSGSALLIMTGAGSYSGDTIINGGTVRLAPATAVASYTFDSVSGSTVTNSGTGGTGMNGTLANGATIATGGHTGNALSLAGGASVDINSGITDLGHTGNWTVTAWVKTTTPGSSILTKSDGKNWSYGNSTFYLGDGADAGSGGVPSAVRWAGGFYQGSTDAQNVADGTWHQVTYVNNSGTYAIYVDGVAQPLAAGNTGFGVPDVGSTVRLGTTTNTSGGDGSFNFNGLMDNVQVYNIAASPSQVSQLYQTGTAFGSLPTTTNVAIAAGGTLDIGGAAQQIGSLSGAAGSNVALGNGRLTVNSSLNSTFAGSITGAGSIVKNGTGTLTLNGTTSYAGDTTVKAGSLVVGSSAQAPILGTSAAGGDVQGGALVFDYSAAGATSPALTVLSILDAGFDQSNKFSGGRLRDSVLPAGQLLGWADDLATKLVTVRPTVAGDANLDLKVNFADLVALAQGYGTTGTAVWSTGDFNYDGATNFADLVSLAQNYNSTVTGSFVGDWALAQQIAVPEPAGALATTLLLSAALSSDRLHRTRR